MKLLNRVQFLNENKFSKLFGEDGMIAELENIMDLDDYQKIIDLGFTDTSSNLQRKRLNFVFSYKGNFINGDKITEDGFNLIKVIKEIYKKSEYYKTASDEKLINMWTSNNVFIIGLAVTQSGYIRYVPIFDSGALDRAQVKTFLKERKTLGEWKEMFSNLVEFAIKLKGKYKLQ